MSRVGSVNAEQEPLLAAGVVAGQATLGGDGFRQRDVKFFVELFSNWLESTSGSSTLHLHNTQIQRALELYVRAGWAKRQRRQPPRYRLTPDGLMELLRRLVRRESLRKLDEFLLIHHFLDAYGTRIRELVSKSGLLASHRLLVDFDELLDARRFIARERLLVSKELARLELRIKESLQMQELTQQLTRSGLSLEEVIAAVEQRFPYELNSQKPLNELLSALPPAWRTSEIGATAERRARRLWAPTHQLLQSYDGILAELAGTS